MGCNLEIVKKPETVSEPGSVDEVWHCYWTWLPRAGLSPEISIEVGNVGDRCECHR